MSDKELSFEQAMERLEQIIRQLERSDLALSESLKLFEEGTGLLSRCSALLDEAEQTVVRLQKGPDRQPVELSFEGED